MEEEKLCCENKETIEDKSEVENCCENKERIEAESEVENCCENGEMITDKSKVENYCENIDELTMDKGLNEPTEDETAAEPMNDESADVPSENEETDILAAEESENSCACGRKTTIRSKEQKKKLLHRLRRIEGQVRGVQAMIEADAYCNDILVQSAAVNAAMNAFNRELLASHLHSCVARDLREGKDEVIDELVGTLKKLLK